MDRDTIRSTVRFPTDSWSAHANRYLLPPSARLGFRVTSDVDRWAWSRSATFSVGTAAEATWDTDGRLHR